MKKTVEAFIADKDVAVAGASRNPEKWGYMLTDMIKKEGYTVHPVNPAGGEVAGIATVSTIQELPDAVNGVIIATRSHNTMDIVKACKEKGIKRVWMHKGAGKGSFDQAAYDFAIENKMEVVYDVCPMMYLSKAGFHRFHKFLHKLFGGMPKELR